jgi:nucleoside phosphorylase
MITIVYAYEPEIRGLRSSLPANFKKNINWHRWKPARLSHSGGSKSDNFPLSGSILNVGFAGSLSSEFVIGDVVLVKKLLSLNDKKVVTLNSEFQESARGFAESRNIPTAVLLTSQNPVLDKSAKDGIKKNTQADIADMEALDIYKLAKSRKMQMISFKIISDNADEFSWNSVKQNRDYLSDKLGETIIDFLKFHFSYD